MKVNKFRMDSWRFGANFLKIKSQTINLTIFRKILIILKILFSEIFFDHCEEHEIMIIFFFYNFFLTQLS